MFVRGEPYLRTRGMVEWIKKCVYGKAPTRYLRSKPIACLWKWPHQKINQLIDAVSHVQENAPQKRFVVGCSPPFMRLAQHLTALRAWCKQCLPRRQKPDMLCPGIAAMRRSTVIRLPGHV